jgi:hypothetical protein
MTIGGGGQQRNNQPTMGAANASGGSGGDGNSDGSGDNGGSGGGEDNRKKQVRLLPQPPFSFLFCAKMEKNCADKKSACKCCEETYFQSHRGNSILFSDIQTVIPFKLFKV